MDYQAIYNNLISKRQSNPATGYIENHHIVMKSMGGTDDSSNLVGLTGREHWIAHLLLNKIHNNRQTACACYMMTMRCEERGIPQIKTSRMYERIRKEHAKIISILNSSNSHKGKNNSQYGSMWICNVDLRENKKIPKNNPIPEGWVKGRNRWKTKKNYYKAKNIEREFLSEPFFINNGKTSKYIKYKDQLPIPSGWIKGRKKAIINPDIEKVRREKISNKMKGPSNPAKTKDWMWITNGTINKKISRNKSIPLGFRRGMTFK